RIEAFWNVQQHPAVAVGLILPVGGPGPRGVMSEPLAVGHVKKLLVLLRHLAAIWKRRGIERHQCCYCGPQRRKLAFGRWRGRGRPVQQQSRERCDDGRICPGHPAPPVLWCIGSLLWFVALASRRAAVSLAVVAVTSSPGRTATRISCRRGRPLRSCAYW